MYILEPVTNTRSSRTVGLPVLAGEAGETLFGAAQDLGESGGFGIQRSGRWFVGRASLQAGAGVENAALQAYAGLFTAARGLHLARIWHYVPRINEPGPDGLENYRAFCRGRSLAFERQYGSGFELRLPSASAVGTDDDRLTVVFAASEVEPLHFENPEQVSAYRYPVKHGPRPPSFARATLVPAPGGLADVFVSGTAAIEGHETVAPGDTARQIERTLRNLRLMSRVCGTGDDLGAGLGGTRHFKVYIKRAGELALIREAFERKLFLPTDRISYLRSDICRAELTLEVEATLTGVRIG